MSQYFSWYIAKNLSQHENDVMGLKHVNLASLAHGLVDVPKEQVLVLEALEIWTLLVLEYGRQDLV